jgi:predicted lipoprotein with Yx(FWY)xxD motif
MPDPVAGAHAFGAIPNAWCGGTTSMHRLLTCAAVAAALTLAGCGGSSNSSDETPARAASSDTVGIQQVTGIGRVLVDASGMALYTPDQEGNGKIVCTGSCTSEWQPVDVVHGKPTAAKGAGSVGVVKRPDGARQATLDGMPLYTFVQDSPGQITGDGFQDKFGGTSFTWHVVLAGGSKGTGVGTDTNNSGSNYGY